MDYINTSRNIDAYNKARRNTKALSCESELLMFRQLIALDLEYYGILNANDTIDCIFSNLNIACNYGGGSNVFFMATELERLLVISEAKCFLMGKINRLNTKHGTIINTLHGEQMTWNCRHTFVQITKETYEGGA